jgi:hypothetical protein
VCSCPYYPWAKGKGTLLQTGPPCRHLLAPERAGAPREDPQAQRKGGHPFRTFEFVEDAPLKLHDPLLLCLVNNPPETFNRVGTADASKVSGEVRRGYRVRRDQSGVQLVVVEAVFTKGGQKVV